MTEILEFLKKYWKIILAGSTISFFVLLSGTCWLINWLVGILANYGFYFIFEPATTLIISGITSGLIIIMIIFIVMTFFIKGSFASGLNAVVASLASWILAIYLTSLSWQIFCSYGIPFPTKMLFVAIFSMIFLLVNYWAIYSVYKFKSKSWAVSISFALFLAMLIPTLISYSRNDYFNPKNGKPTFKVVKNAKGEIVDVFRKTPHKYDCKTGNRIVDIGRDEAMKSLPQIKRVAKEKLRPWENRPHSQTQTSSSQVKSRKTATALNSANNFSFPNASWKKLNIKGKKGQILLVDQLKKGHIFYYLGSDGLFQSQIDNGNTSCWRTITPADFQKKFTADWPGALKFKFKKATNVQVAIRANS